MRIIQACSGVLSNFEVHQLIKEEQQIFRRGLQQQHGNSGAPSSSSVGTMTEHQMRQSMLDSAVLAYIEQTCPIVSLAKTSEASIQKLLDCLVSQFDLAQSELLQIVNLVPISPVELYAIIEDCPNRFSEDQIDQMASRIKEYISTHGDTEEGDLRQQTSDVDVGQA